MRHHQIIQTTILMFCLSLLFPLMAFAGGTIKGKVTFLGKVPPPKEFSFSKFPNSDFCRKNSNKTADGETRLLKEVEVDENKGLKNAIVSLRDIKDKDWMKAYKQTEVVSDLCEWFPYTGVVVNKGQFSVENLDADPNDPKAKEGVLHNPHGFDVLGAKSSTLFNVGLAKKGDVITKRLKMRMAKKGSAMRLQCDQHEFMQAWFLPVENPHFSKSAEDGTFEIQNVPAGPHTLLAWHPIAGQTKVTVHVDEGETAEVNFKIAGN